MECLGENPFESFREATPNRTHRMMPSGRRSRAVTNSKLPKVADFKFGGCQLPISAANLVPVSKRL